RDKRRHLTHVHPLLSGCTAKFCPYQAIALKGKNAELSIGRAVEPLLDNHFLPDIRPEGVANQITLTGCTAFAFDLECPVARTHQLSAATQGVGLDGRDRKTTRLK